MRIFVILLALMLFAPVSKAEPSPMEQSYEGNPIVVINLTYEAGIGGGDDIPVSYTHLTLPTKA